jgi:hypothetical protein
MKLQGANRICNADYLKWPSWLAGTLDVQEGMDAITPASTKVQENNNDNRMKIDPRSSGRRTWKATLS